MKKNKFDIVEDDDVVIYDESDDYDPGEDSAETGEFRLMTNEEIFTDEYMQDYAAKMDAKIAREKRNDRLISIAVIIGIILFVAAVVYINFKQIL